MPSQGVRRSPEGIGTRRRKTPATHASPLFQKIRIRLCGVVSLISLYAVAPEYPAGRLHCAVTSHKCPQPPSGGQWFHEIKFDGFRVIAGKEGKRVKPGLRFTEHLDEENGRLVFQHACKLGLEGIVSKRRDSSYSSGRSPHWIKSKNPNAPAVKREAEENWGGWPARQRLSRR
jgi:hypothetical protein